MAVWSPYTFSHVFLGILSLVAFALCLTTFLLWWRSSKNFGLGPDNGSSPLLFGWRYSPTLIAVLYVQMTTVLFEDVKRTEPYARLSRPKGAEALTSVLKAPGAWWNALIDGFSKNKNGSRSWILICTAMINILGFMAISPLSSAFLISEEVVVPRTTNFTGVFPAAGSGLKLNSDRFSHFRTIVHLLQNVSTLPWVTDEYTLFPFWPSYMQDAISSLPTSSSQKWEADTTVFKTEMKCNKMSLKSKSFGNATQNQTVEPASQSFIWGSKDGCTYGIASSYDTFYDGAGSWSDASTFYNVREVFDSFSADRLAPTLSNSTAACGNREVITIFGPPKSETELGIAVAHLCDTRHYMAQVATSIALDGAEPEITFDETEFERKKAPIPDNILNTTQFDALMLDPNWPTYLLSIYRSGTRKMGGPSTLLGALYGYNLSAMLNNSEVDGLNLIQLAAMVKQRFFGEVLQSALTKQGALEMVPMKGQLHQIETRIVVQTGVALSLGVLLALSFCFALAIWWLSRPNRRHLNLTGNPLTTLGVAYLLTHSHEAVSIFRRFKQRSHDDLREKLTGEWFHTNSNGLVRVTADGDMNWEHEVSQSENGTPNLLRLPTLLILVTALIALIVGIAVLYHFSGMTGLYEKAFVWQIQLSSTNKGLSSVAPFSIIPTLFATGISLWWGAIDDNFRRLQPFLAMCNKGTRFSRGPGLSYQSTFWVWAFVKALLNKHWLLAFITLGSTLSPICGSIF